MMLHKPSQAIGRWALAAAISLLAGTVVSSTAVSAESGSRAVEEFALPSGNSIGVTAGPDGNVWFTTSDAKLGRITRSGDISEFAIPPVGPGVPQCAPDCSRGQYITTGPDGNLWFTQPFVDSVARAQISASGVVFTEYTVPTNCPPALRFCLDGITAGPDGNLWFSESTRGRIGQLNPMSGLITEFPGAQFPLKITAGPDGNVWFGDPGAGGLGRITPAGAITEFPFPNPELTHGGPSPNPDGDPDVGDFYSIDPSGGLAVGSDGNLWAWTAVFWGDNSSPACPNVTNDDLCSGFGYYLTSQWVMVVSPVDGTVQKEFRVPGTQGNPQSLARGSDGNIWIPMRNAVGPSPWQGAAGMQVTSVSPTGELVNYATRFPNPNDIAAGPHGTMWFTEQGHIGRIKACSDECESEGNDG